MKTRETTPGRTYSVHTMKGCTIIAPDGWQKTIEAPDGYFDAHFGSVVIEGDDEASIKELFKLAPYQKLRLIGVVGGNKLPSGYTRLAYLEGTGTQYINSDTNPYIYGDAFGYEVSWMWTNDIGIWETNTTVIGSRIGYPSTRRGIEISRYGSKIHLEWGATILDAGSSNRVPYYKRVTAFFKDLIFTIPEYSVSQEIPASNGELPNKNLGLFAISGGQYPSDVRMYYLTCYDGDNLVANYIPALNPEGQPGMYNTVSKVFKTNSGTGAFIAGIETQKQLDTLILKLPDRTGLDVGTLQVRLSETLQTPENEAKLDAMLSKNWEISQAA